MIKRTKKICKGCGTYQYIFSKGNCKACAARLSKSIKKEKKIKTSDLEKVKDSLYSQVRRLEASNKSGFLHCYICGQVVHWKHAQLMHYISRAKKTVRFDDMNCHAGCYTCNVTKHGNLIEYKNKLILQYGESALYYLEQKSKEKNRYTVVQLQEDIQELILRKEKLLKKLL